MAKGKPRQKKVAPVPKDGPSLKLSAEDREAVELTMKTVRDAHAQIGFEHERHDANIAALKQNLRGVVDEQRGVISVIRKRMGLPEGTKFDPERMEFIVPS